MLPKTAKEAVDAGLKYYETGEPCSRGHLAPRYVKNYTCLECKRANFRKWLKSNPEKMAAAKRSWRERNPEKAKAGWDGWYSANRERCIAQKTAYNKKHKDRLTEYRKVRYEEHGDDLRARAREWKSHNPERNSALTNKWRAENKAHMRLYSLEWRKANPEKARATYSRRWARKNNALGQFTADDLTAIRKAQKDKCAYCRKPLRKGGTVDHIIPLSKGGNHFASNIQLLCKPCNSSKGAKDALEFSRSRGFLL